MGEAKGGSRKPPAVRLGEGQRVKIMWPDGKWYVGVVCRYDVKKVLHTILFDVGDLRRVDLRTAKWELEGIPNRCCDNGDNVESEILKSYSNQQSGGSSEGEDEDFGASLADDRRRLQSIISLHRKGRVGGVSAVKVPGGRVRWLKGGEGESQITKAKGKRGPKVLGVLGKTKAEGKLQRAEIEQGMHLENHEGRKRSPALRIPVMTTSEAVRVQQSSHASRDVVLDSEVCDQVMMEVEDLEGEDGDVEARELMRDRLLKKRRSALEKDLVGHLSSDDGSGDSVIEGGADKKSCQRITSASHSSGGGETGVDDGKDAGSESSRSQGIAVDAQDRVEEGLDGLEICSKERGEMDEEGDNDNYGYGESGNLPPSKNRATCTVHEAESEGESKWESEREVLRAIGPCDNKDSTLPQKRKKKRSSLAQTSAGRSTHVAYDASSLPVVKEESIEQRQQSSSTVCASETAGCGGFDAQYASLGGGLRGFDKDVSADCSRFHLLCTAPASAGHCAKDLIHTGNERLVEKMGDDLSAGPFGLEKPNGNLSLPISFGSVHGDRNQQIDSQGKGIRLFGAVVEQRDTRNINEGALAVGA